MELADALARRRMVRRYDPDAPVPADAVEAVVAAALRAPSAGFTQGVSLLVLDAPQDVRRFWSATVLRGDDPPHPPQGVPVAGAPETRPGASNRWLDGMRTAPVLVLVLTDREAYLDRYAEPDKGWTDRDEGRWSAPYWFVDAGMAAMAMLLRAVDLGLGACFFGVPPERADAVHAAFGVPADQLGVGVVSLGHAPATGERGSRGSPARRPRKPAAEVVHRGRW
ncbi:Nitroreductase [Microlunatus sagamiharensis]|uniref:Nitroreductase n=1 Tax=Microlunatus sagamiharensis TaxID=546874 RepID=A0A1H2MVR6_9ACTN|nr:nitroreductase family protein [Microlunatus sagamiharensis]SDU97204.1 Nitroreductase [Microlunatus sagamiharensis]